MTAAVQSAENRTLETVVLNNVFVEIALCELTASAAGFCGLPKNHELHVRYRLNQVSHLENAGGIRLYVFFVFLLKSGFFLASHFFLTSRSTSPETTSLSLDLGTNGISFNAKRREAEADSSQD